jgi:glycosyltransferase involved in cell wall biosynthesis
MKPKRILIITDMPVWPPLAGDKARAWALMNNLRRLGHEVSFLGLGLSQETVEALTARWGAGIHNVRRIRARWEKPRIQALKRIILDRFFFAWGIGSPGVDQWMWPRWERGIAEFGARHTFDVVIAEHVFFSKALLHFGPEVLKIVDAHDVWTGRREKLKTRNVHRFSRYLTDAAEEARGLKRADLVMSIQESESIFFRKILDDSRPVVTVGHTVDPQPLPLPINSDLLFVASAYGPNVEGLLHFLEACLPGIRAVVPEARVLVAGSICDVLPPDLPGVKLLGLVENVESAYRMAGLVINPVRTGTGLKTKTIEALAFYRALVTTPCGAEGLEAGAGNAFQVAGDDAQFSSAIVELLTNREKLENIAAGGLEFAKRWNGMQIEALQSILSTRDLSA